MSPPRAAAPFVRNPLLRLEGVSSSYDAEGETGSEWGKRVDLATKRTGWGTDAMRTALRAAQGTAHARGGTIGVTEAYRSFAVSQRAHEAYQAGKRKHYACPGGGSIHNAGQAVDIDVYHLGAIDLAGVWDIMIPLGFSPIITSPDPKRSECWHFDFRGEWRDFYAYLKEHHRSAAYTQLARALTLDAGAWDTDASGWNLDRLEVAYIQAQLHRIGVHVVGTIDGHAGANTRRAVSAAFPEGAQPGAIEDHEARKVIAQRLNEYPTPLIRRHRAHWRAIHD